MSAEVTVRGTAVVAARPDHVELLLLVRAVEPTADAALGVVATRSQALAALLEELAVDPSDRVTTGLSVREETDWVDGQNVHRGYGAQAQLKVRLDDADRVGELMRRAVEVAAVDLGGPWWRIAPENPAHDDARVQAAGDARRRATAYAVALGLRVGAVVRIAEPGLGPDRSGAEPGVVFSRAASDVDVEAGDLDVTAAVEVTFRLEPEAPLGRSER